MKYFNENTKITIASSTICFATTSGEYRPPPPEIILVSGGFEVSSTSNPGVSVSGGNEIVIVTPVPIVSDMRASPNPRTAHFVAP